MPTPVSGRMQRLFSELPGRVLLGNCVSGIHLCYSAWQAGLPKEAGSKEDKMSIFPTRILLATDGLEEATLAAQAAIDLANKTGSELHVVHVRISLYSPAFSKAYEGYEEGVDVGACLRTKAKSTQGEDRVYSTSR